MDDLKETVLLWTGVSLLFIAVLTLITNGVLLFTMYHNPLRCFRDTTATYVACLAVTDFLTGSVTAMDVGVSSLLNYMGIHSFKIKGVLHEKLLSQFTVRSGILVVVAFSFERFLAVAFPFFYRSFLSPKKALTCCIICCIVGLIASLLELILDKETFANMSYYGFFVAPLCLIVILYLLVFIAVKTKLLRAPKRKIFVQKGHMISEKVRLQREVRIGMTAFYIVLGFIFSYSFWFTVVLIGANCHSCVTKSWYYACYRSSIPFLYVNSSLNPLLYAWRISKYRRSILLVFKRNIQVYPMSRPQEQPSMELQVVRQLVQQK
ncbi:hypothetical protein QZH41_003539 [Actinostola sp. cb2023]|nr:hypothetical protein QZH41_003539 [Actinostola sp. cb2023]